MDRKQINQRLADALGGTERAMEQLRYKQPNTAGSRLLRELLLALDQGRKVVLSGEAWSLEFQPELRELRRSDNTMFLLRLYRYEGHWVFDDEERNLKREPFISDTDALFTEVSKELPGAEKTGFALQFSDRPFPGHHLTLERLREEYSGWWYAVRELGGAEGWFGPLIHCYFEDAPEQIYAQVRPVT